MVTLVTTLFTLVSKTRLESIPYQTNLNFLALHMYDREIVKLIVVNLLYIYIYIYIYIYTHTHTTLQGQYAHNLLLYVI